MPVQHIRIPADDWAEFNAAAGGNGAEVVRRFIRFYLHRKGARQVRRPDPPPRG